MLEKAFRDKNVVKKCAILRAVTYMCLLTCKLDNNVIFHLPCISNLITANSRYSKFSLYGFAMVDYNQVKAQVRFKIRRLCLMMLGYFVVNPAAIQKTRHKPPLTGRGLKVYTTSASVALRLGSVSGYQFLIA